MKTATAKTALTFGGLVASFYNAHGERNAKWVLRLAMKVNFFVLRGIAYYVTSGATGKA